MIIVMLRQSPLKFFCVAFLAVMAIIPSKAYARPSSQRSTVETSNTPIVLVPGLAGSQMQAQFTNVHQPHFFCKKTTKGKSKQMWLSITQILPEEKDCLLSDILMTYNASTDEFADTPGVNLNTNVDFGNVGGISSLDPALAGETGYFKTMIRFFQKPENGGYTPGVDLLGAPYDWRGAPTSWSRTGKYYSRLRSLIEAQNLPVHLITHSLGGPTMLAFLNTMTQDWINAHIESFIPISGPFGGAMQQIVAYVNGDNFGIPLVPNDYLRPLQTTAPSGTFMIPTESAFGTQVLVQTPSRNYSSYEMTGFLSDLALEQSSNVRKDLYAKGTNMANLTVPTVPTHVIVSHNVSTTEGLVFPDNFTPGYKKKPVNTIMGDGDGTVNLQSLLVPQLWVQYATANLTFFNVSGVSHFSMVSDPSVLAYLRELIIK